MSDELTTRTHLRYESVEEWIKSEGIPTPVSQIKDQALRDKYWLQFAELRRYLFEKHFASLPSEEQQMLKEKKHPSQSHVFFELAKRYLEDFKKTVPALGCIEKIGLGCYHADRIVIDVFLVPGTDVAEVRKHIPQFYSGFEVFCLTPNKS
jgi:hypothetical protein